MVAVKLAKHMTMYFNCQRQCYIKMEHPGLCSEHFRKRSICNGKVMVGRTDRDEFAVVG